MKKTLTKGKIINTLKKELPSLRDKYGVVRLILFGSFAKNQQKKGSDIDLLVELEKPLGLEFVGLAYYLEDKLGAKVDIATYECFENSFNKPRYRHIAEDIKRNMIYVE